jgi:hypothetical protein
MATVKFDGTLNIPTLLTIFGGIVTALGVLFSVRGDVKTHTVQINQMNIEIGELRKIAMTANRRVDSQEKAVQQVTKTAEANKIQITKNTSIVKKIPDIVAAQVNK